MNKNWKIVIFYILQENKQSNLHANILKGQPVGTHVIVYVKLSFSASVDITVKTVSPFCVVVETSVAAEKY